MSINDLDFIQNTPVENNIYGGAAADVFTINSSGGITRVSNNEPDSYYILVPFSGVTVEVTRTQFEQYCGCNVANL